MRADVGPHSIYNGTPDMNEELLKVIVSKREIQGDGVVVLDLTRPDGGPLPVFEAGAHVDIYVAPGLIRQYSLCGDPANAAVYRLGVLKDPASRGGSTGVHEVLLEGTEVTISAPRNHFPLATQVTRSILIGGGIGITPMIAMAYALQADGQDFELHYCARSHSSTAFLNELQSADFASRVSVHFDDEAAAQKLDLNAVLGTSKAGVHVYTCGPAGFMDWVIATALEVGYADAQIHREYFQVEVDVSGESFEVVAARSGKTVQVAAGQTILEALAGVGIKIEISCEQGVCGTCVCDVLEGEPDHRDVYLTDDEKADNDQILVCCSRAKSKKLVLDI
ncbi:Flavodoxin reductase (ferredoxin-NADPH reductase) family 1 [Pseudomonas chlororaphis subsp. aureofaciens]|nr:Flavodoxin reductase (ferredoxin-NADPH reductase) family 1 [Pseudomonas chlororaphis subsp. aurantiaca]AZD93699.1 Flavodoxin reductase (ferredoxin-NADPH reductase) family 1 [Pseudomonas chlororaphis subsp. aureofaciens]SDS45312.1 vanillate O-demethylase ferredoxin subunit [Pseudomonas chlororaphis]AZD49507.1 Flavodoxin reductase (ferredoxin-NADPH reductase) family 1 [Pseudomonas chlororaphis subsp. aurantiaca]AZD80630.1 Flavodoxin reductase (ferredoxin-NADPH reductase) family 1 [Pseudomonas 